MSSPQDSELSKVTSFDNDVPIQALIATICEISKVSEISSVTAKSEFPLLEKWFSLPKEFAFVVIHSQEPLATSSGSRHFDFEFIDLSAIGSSLAEFHSSVFTVILRNSKVRINDAEESDTLIEFVLDGLFLIFNKGSGGVLFNFFIYRGSKLLAMSACASPFKIKLQLHDQIIIIAKGVMRYEASDVARILTNKSLVRFSEVLNSQIPYIRINVKEHSSSSLARPRLYKVPIAPNQDGLQIAEVAWISNDDGNGPIMFDSNGIVAKFNKVRLCGWRGDAFLSEKLYDTRRRQLSNWLCGWAVEL